MQILDYLAQDTVVFLVIIGLLGLMVGSFLNVVIYRLPVMMQNSWRQECLEFLDQATEPAPAEPFNLAYPQSRCPGCGALIKPYQNIPMLSYLLLKGQCANCHISISVRYPLIEALTAVMSIIVAWRFGFTWQTGFGLLLTWSLIALCFIDFDHQLLPDSITLPMLWLGLFLSIFGLFADSHASIIGAIAGYLILWSVFQLFKILTGKEGMGYGDFKLLALFGAWLGWQYLPMIILLSSLAGAIIGTLMILFVKHDRNTPIPFGPYLAVAGWIALIWGETINQAYFKISGL